jgi:hypothetical protein
VVNIYYLLYDGLLREYIGYTENFVSVESAGFQWWCITLRINGFLDFVHRPVIYELGNAAFRNWIYFSLQVKGGRQLLCWVS